MATDPVPLRHDHPRPRPARAVAAELAQLAGHRRSGARRRGPADLRLSHLGPVRAGADHPVLDRRRGGGPGAGLLRRLGGPDRAAPDRDLERPADPVHADHPVQHRGAELLVAARSHAVRFLDAARRSGARRDLARAQLRLRPRRARAGRRQPRHHVAPRAAQRPGLDPDLHAVRPDRLDHAVDRAGLSRLRPAARVGVAGRAACRRARTT